jgi:hypothetical protein
MPNQKPEAGKPTPEGIRLTVRLKLNAYDSVIEIQRVHRRTTGKAISKGEVISSAVLAYGKQKGAKVGE